MKLCYYCMTRFENDNTKFCPRCGKVWDATRSDPRYLKPGTILQNRFIVGKPLGAGGFGNTYIGWNQVLMRKVAIKEYYPAKYSERAQDGITISVISEELQPKFHKGLKSFLEEARNVASLQGIKGVVEISNFFEENGTGYIIMEYLEGMDVKTILQKSGNRKDYEWCRRVILTVLYTLREIHKKGVLHRDISPDNIFVTNEGVIKLIDFGAARHSTALANIRSQIILKAGYAPIEQYSIDAPQGPYTDIYAVAALFYRMLTGQKPLPANERLHNDAMIPPSEMGIAIPEQAELGIMVSLNVAPQYRLQSADEFMEVLDGKDFVPVYEPKWILPPVEEKLGFSTLPVVAKVAICVGIIALITVGVAGGIHVATNSSKQEIGLSGDDFMLQDYSGIALSEVQAQLERAGIPYSCVYVFSDEEEDIVVSQYPAAGEKMKNEEVVLYVSGGDQQVTLDDFTGLSRDEIIAWFSGSGYKLMVNDYPDGQMSEFESSSRKKTRKKSGTVELRYEYTAQYEKDTCYRQSVPTGIILDGTEDIIFTVSCGALSDYEIPIPDLKNMSVTEAKRKLEDAGLATKLIIRYKESGKHDASVDEGHILKQSRSPRYIYNTLENRFYQYNGTERTKVRDDKELILTVNKAAG